MLDATEITRLDDQATLHWHQTGEWPDPSVLAAFEHQPATRLLHAVLANHRANFDLWHKEDEAREPDTGDSAMASIKHAIDALNQQRNDLVETIDRILLEAAGEQNPAAPLHSETPGLILDRLSILALKIFHTAEESRRASASEAHRRKNLDRLALLEEQRSDLAACLEALWTDVLHRRRRFKLYRQMKMYNDPQLNPAIYSHEVTPKTS